MIKIISDGTTIGTFVEEDGKKLQNISRVEILPIDCKDQIVQARITFIKIPIEITAKRIEDE